MALPLRYSLRNVTVRRVSAVFTALGIAMTVAVFAGVISLRNGFEQLYKDRGREELAVYLRPGAMSEGESGLRREQVEILVKERPEIARDEATGRPLAAAESFLAVYMEMVDGGRTNVPLRGIQPMSIPLRHGRVDVKQGRWFEWGTDEVVVGRPLTERMVNAQVGDTLILNMTPFKVVGVLESESAEGGEVWGDVERMLEALQRPAFSRVIAEVLPGTDIPAISAELEHDPRVPVQVFSEREYMARQTNITGTMLTSLADMLSVIMGLAAVLGAMNTMLASVASRTHEIGVLLALGYRRGAIFLSFLIESAAIGLLGGLLGLLIALPFHGVETGLANWNTFTDVSFAFSLTPTLALQSFLLAFVLGVLGGALPALRAARLRPVEAFREH
ncbi:MAG: ABC transporter permease [Planctomycetota bacterium]|jgi:putative ABC transport system permease protein